MALSNRWFHYISGIDAERLLLEKGVNGSFLARPSYSSPGSFTLSVRRGNEVTHIKIQNTDDFLDLYGGEKFATLNELISYYMEGKELKEKNGQIIELKYPLPSDDPTTERWFHGEMNGHEAEKLLLEKGKNGSFLVRESQRVLGSYVVSVKSGDHVDHVMIYRNKDSHFDIGGGRQFSNLKELIDFYIVTPMVEKSGSLVSLIHPLNSTRVNVMTLTDRMNQLEKNNGRGGVNGPQQGFLEEFDELQQDARNKNLTREEGSKHSNPEKNRYRNILPFDNTRVILHDGDEKIPGSDYINANYIVCPYENDNSIDYSLDANTPTLKYIATQGTLDNTVVDFWRMVWQEKSIVIAMITKEKEKGKAKCVPYWPTAEERVRHFNTYRAKLSVELVSEQSTKSFIIREMLLTRTDAKVSEAFKVFQYHFTAWPDHGTPKDPSELLGFMERCNDKQYSVSNAGPMVVHCSAGIGRSGTFIAIDILINQIREDLQKDIDILRTVQIIRDQRSGMVQTETQYRFVYQAVAEFVQLEKKRQNILKDAKKSGREYINLKRFPDILPGGGGSAPSNSTIAPSTTPPVLSVAPTNIPFDTVANSAAPGASSPSNHTNMLAAPPQSTTTISHNNQSHYANSIMMPATDSTSNELSHLLQQQQQPFLQPNTLPRHNFSTNLVNGTAAPVATGDGNNQFASNTIVGGTGRRIPPPLPARRTECR